ncbi:F-type H-ATPase delta subunit, partial [Thalassiosira pseudonana CCMP1335]
RRTFSSEAAPASGLMKLNFNLPQETLYDAAPVKSVVVPGAMGEYEVTADHVPIVAELKAGMLTINHEGGESEKYFVAGGFSLTHEGSTTDIVCPEAVKLDDIDSAAVQTNYEAAKAKASSAEAGSAEAAEAMIEVEV